VSDEKHPLPPPVPRVVLTAPAHLPPAPKPPLRSLTPSAQRAGKRDFDLDDSTPARNETAATYASLLSVFDGMTQPERFEFVELARLFAELTTRHREVAAEAIRQLLERQNK
jgi:hypothetical protein